MDYGGNMLNKLIEELNEMNRTVQLYYKEEQWVLLERAIRRIKVLTIMIDNNLEKNERIVPTNEQIL